MFEIDGIMCMIPEVVYPKKYTEELQAEIADVKEKIAFGEQPVFNNLDDLFTSLEEE